MLMQVMCHLQPGQAGGMNVTCSNLNNSCSFVHLRDQVRHVNLRCWHLQPQLLPLRQFQCIDLENGVSLLRHMLEAAMAFQCHACSMALICMLDMYIHGVE